MRKGRLMDRSVPSARARRAFQSTDTARHRTVRKSPPAPDRPCLDLSRRREGSHQTPESPREGNEAIMPIRLLTRLREEAWLIWREHQPTRKVNLEDLGRRVEGKPECPLFPLPVGQPLAAGPVRTSGEEAATQGVPADEEATPRATQVVGGERHCGRGLTPFECPLFFSTGCFYSCPKCKASIFPSHQRNRGHRVMAYVKSAV
jgi:hypothetical protein